MILVIYIKIIQIYQNIINFMKRNQKWIFKAKLIIFQIHYGDNLKIIWMIPELKHLKI